MAHETPNLRLRIKLPGGAEFEAEGPRSFITEEKDVFLSELREAAATAPGAAAPPAQNRGGARSGPTEPGAPNISWDAVIERRGDRQIQLRGKLKAEHSEKEACLVLLAAAEKLLNEPKPRATLLAKWLRSSGYAILRIDRAIQEGLSQGQIIASGAKRARRYELTGPGRIKAYLLAHELSRTITGLP
ncbi:MAG TPA: hypothetical protein VNK24_04680 [Elusimicrobiota bacterium]|nr:hypothetical protein [Elusimicrobiota bacterium]